MPEFDLTEDYNGGQPPKQQIEIVPTEGDVRLEANGNLEHYIGYWSTVGNIQQLFNDYYEMQGAIQVIQSQQSLMQDRILELQRNRELEEEFPDLGAAGEYCEEIRAMLKKANDGYNKMILKTLEKKKIYDILAVED